MSDQKCPFCNSDNVKRLKDYCAAVSTESSRDLLERIKPRFKYGLHIGIAGIACVLIAFIVYNNSAYQNTFWDRDSIITINQNGGLGCAGLLGVFIIAIFGISATVWGYKKHKENQTYSGDQDKDQHFYETAVICRDCHKAWVPGFEETKRLFS